MSISAATLQLLMEAGLQGESLLNVVRSIEADTAKPSPADRTSAERQRRYRARRDNGGMTGHQWKRVSAQVLAGSDYRCAYCEAEASHCDHVQPLSQGGGNEEGNLVACCVVCNSAKAGKTLEQWKGEAWAQSWRDKRRNVTASPAPSFLSLSPTPPNPNQSTPNPPPYSPPALKPDDVWAITPRQGRERSSKRDVERAFAAAVKRGGSPEAILAGVKAYYASDDATRDGGQFAKGVHRIIENDRWQSYTPEDKPPDWENFLATWRATGRWPKSLGPPPDHPETQVPSALRAA